MRIHCSFTDTHHHTDKLSKREWLRPTIAGRTHFASGARILHMQQIQKTMWPRFRCSSALRCGGIAAPCAKLSLTSHSENGVGGGRKHKRPRRRLKGGEGVRL